MEETSLTIYLDSRSEKPTYLLIFNTSGVTIQLKFTNDARMTKEAVDNFVAAMKDSQNIETDLEGVEKEITIKLKDRRVNFTWNKPDEKGKMTTTTLSLRVERCMTAFENLQRLVSNLK